MWGLDDLRALEAVMRDGSFAAAARRLGVTRSAVSKAIRRLEDAFEVQLFVRTTHEVTPTDAGLLLHRKAAGVLAAADEAVAAVRDRRDEAVGTVRLSVSTGLGLATVCDWLPELLAEHPGLSVDLSLSDRRVRVVADGYDLVLRVAFAGGLPDSDLVARRLATGRMRLCASPAWVARHGAPGDLDALADAPAIAFSHALAPDRTTGWTLDQDVVRVTGPMRADNGLAVRAAVLGGLGIGLLPGFLVVDALATGRLVPVLPGVRTPEYGVYALRPAGTYVSRATRTVLGFLGERMAAAEV
jgi:DNA-binding transcriptional LysR family regulator